MNKFAILVPVALMAACKDNSQASVPARSPEPAASAVAIAPPVPASDAKARSVKVENDLYSFSFEYPAKAAEIPALKARLDSELDQAQREIAAMAREGRDDAKASGYDYNRYDRSVGWAVVTDLPGWLSLSSQFYEFTGGAHGNHGSGTLVWDKAAGRARDPLDLFVSKAAFDAALSGAYCTALNKERAERRGEPVGTNGEAMFEDCLKPSGVTVLLGSADKRHFTRIGLVADPYAAGPYAEGSYELTLPVTPALIKAVRPEFRAAFAPGR